MLALELTFLTGRYVATSFDDRWQAEWPPHPARLFSALVATLFEGESIPGAAEALAWLERQGPPAIAASEAVRREVVTHFVPVNDTSVIASLDKELAAVEAAREAAVEASSEGAKALATARKKLEAAERKLKERTELAVAAGSGSKQDLETAPKLLPDRRVRQPRTFPSVAPEDPRVVFIWKEAEPIESHRRALDALAARVVRVGHSSSFVSLRLVDDAPTPTWLPDEDGDLAAEDARTLRVVAPGQLERLREAFERNGDSSGRVLPASFRRYVKPVPINDQAVHRGAFGEDWIVLRRIGGPRLPSIRAVEVARTLRKALLRAYGSDIPEILSGHRGPDLPSDHHHLAFVPLPFVGNQHADGSILGVALVLPRRASAEERKAVFRALANWEQARRAEEPEAEAPGLPLLMGRTGKLILQRLEGRSSLETLRPWNWTVASRVWATVTPVVLDRNPGNLRSSNPEVEAAAYAKAESIIANACSHVGLPAPEAVEVMPAAPFAGAAKARHFPPFTSGNPPIQRVHVHALIRFPARVAGPVLLGAGRYFGLGLFRPVREHG